MERPIVKITDISNLLGENLPVNKPVQLGDPRVDSRVNSLLAAIRGHVTHAYILR